MEKQELEQELAELRQRTELLEGLIKHPGFALLDEMLKNQIELRRKQTAGPTLTLKGMMKRNHELGIADGQQMARALAPAMVVHGKEEQKQLLEQLRLMETPDERTS